MIVKDEKRAYAIRRKNEMLASYSVRMLNNFSSECISKDTEIVTPAPNRTIICEYIEGENLQISKVAPGHKFSVFCLHGHKYVNFSLNYTLVILRRFILQVYAISFLNGTLSYTIQPSIS